jgi:5-formyltetrahydrofolate cyclo-ligase
LWCRHFILQIDRFSMAFTSLDKARARNAAKIIRAGTAKIKPDAGVECIRHWSKIGMTTGVVAAYLPIQNEIDTRPLMKALQEDGHQLALPCIKRAAHPLEFRQYDPGDKLRGGPYGTKEPLRSAELLEPDIILLPMLAFTATGVRLGYGGGFYDRSIAALRAKKQIFACGLAYAAQEVPVLPADEHDQPLDGVLTEAGFKRF